MTPVKAESFEGHGLVGSKGPALRACKELTPGIACGMIRPSPQQKSPSMDPQHIDPFEQKRKESGVLPCDFEGERVPMILRHADVKAATKDWHKFSSDAPR